MKKKTLKKCIHFYFPILYTKIFKIRRMPIDAYSKSNQINLLKCIFYNTAVKWTLYQPCSWIHAVKKYMLNSLNVL